MKEGCAKDHYEWTEKDIKLLTKKYPSASDLKILAVEMGRTVRAIKAKAYLLNICRDINDNDYNRIWTEEEEQYLKDNYYKGNLYAVAKKIKRTKKAITERAKHLKIYRDPETVRLTCHKYTINEDFFKTWSDDMAYILGFIWSDGCMHGGDDYAISITQHKKDKYILKNI